MECRSVFGACVLLLAAALAGGAQAQAPAWPTKQTIRLISPFPPGSAVDAVARPVFDNVSRRIGQTIVYESRPGAGGTLGMAAVAKAEPDGYTLLVNSSVHTITPSTYSRLPYDTVRDFAAVIPLAQYPNVLVVPPSRFKTVQELVAAGKAKPGSITYGSGGVGAATHLNAERFRLSAGFEQTMVVSTVLHSSYCWRRHRIHRPGAANRRASSACRPSPRRPPHTPPGRPSRARAWP